MTRQRRYENQVAIVTGAAGGIGEVYARALVAEGASVLIADVDVKGGEAAAADISSGGSGRGRATFARVDISDPESTQAMAATAVEQFGGIDLLVNNAAIYGDMRVDTLLGVEWDYYQRFMRVNLDGALLCIRACHPHMLARGGGAIVNQSSTAAWMYAGFYGLAKVGINGLTQQLAHELGGSGIRVNAIAPGPIDTEATRSVVPDAFIDQMVQGLAIKRRGTPQDLAGLCLFLLSDEASWITGQIFNVDGGQVVRS